VTKLEKHLLESLGEVMEQLEELRQLYDRAYREGQHGVPAVPRLLLQRNHQLELTDRSLVEETKRVLEGLLDMPQQDSNTPRELVSVS